MAAATKRKIENLEERFREAFGRPMTPAERRLLQWAEDVAPSEQEQDGDDEAA